MIEAANNEKMMTRLLVVEDDPGLRELIVDLLEDENCCVICCELGEAALQNLQDHHYDMMLLDYRLPDMTAFDLLERARKRRKEIPSFIVTTGMGDEKIAVEMMKQGACDYLVKDGQFLNLLPVIVTRTLQQLRTERQLRRTRLELATTEGLFRAIFEQSAIGMARSSLAGELQNVNQRFCELIGYPPSELIGMSVCRLAHVDDLAEQERLRKQLLAGEIEKFSKEQRFCHKSGATVWGNMTVSLLREPDGTPQQIVTMVEDLTEQKRIEEELQWEMKVKSSLSDLFEPIMSTAISPLALAQVIHDKACELTGSSRAFVTRFAGEKSLDVLLTHSEKNSAQNRETFTVISIPPDDHGLYPEPLFNTLNRRETSRINTPFSPFTLPEREKPIQLQRFLSIAVTLNDELVGSIGVADARSDYTSRHLYALQRLGEFYALALQRLRYDERLDSERQQLNAILDHSSSGIMLVGKNGQILFANRRMSELCFPCDKSLVGVPYLDLLHPSERDGAKDRIQQAFGESQVGIYAERQFLRQDGKTFWGLLSGRPLRNSFGKIDALVVVVTDISDRHKTEKALRCAKEAAEAANLAKSEFLANMSHELRTPLNGILGMLQLLEQGESEGEQKEMIDIALSSGWGLLELMNDLLDLSSIEVGGLKIRKESFDMHQLVLDASSLFKEQAQQKGVDLHLRLPDLDGERFIGDAVRLRQILFNLIGNAVKFTHCGQIAVNVERLTSVTPDNNMVVISVRDTGIGMSQHLLARIFQPFTQEERSLNRHYAGAGLGLALVKRLCELLGGRIEIESQLGRGTNVKVSLPLERMGKVSPDLLSQKASRHAVERPLHLLVAEDNEINQTTIISMLSKCGYQATLACNGLEVLNQVQQQRFDAILMDISMPGIDGIEATRRLRTGEQGVCDPQIPVIALTAHAMIGDQEQFLDAGMQGYLAKPVMIEHLIETLEDVVPKTH